MKKYIILFMMLFCLFGCVNIKESSIDNLILQTVRSKQVASNQFRTGYKYYLPTTLNNKSSKDYNEILEDNKYSYYLFVDLVSYYKNIKKDYVENSTSYYSKKLNINNKDGYLEINQKDTKYLIEIMYNYAKIEVIVDEEDINSVISNCLIVLSNLKYSDDIIKNLMDDNTLNFSEETFNIFDTDAEESNFLDIVEEYGTYEGEDAIPDYDLIN